MLAERRQKQKWSLNPRGKFWSEDQNKFGQKMLERMGWSAGKGLGANEDGITEHISQAYKNDTKGIGFKDRDDQWTEHEDKFTSLLASLGQGTTDIEKPKSSLVTRSENSRARVHYHKFTRGKDLSMRSEKDLANIFGRKALEKKKEEIVVETKQEEQDKDFGVKTLQAGSMADYFKNKLEKLGQTLSPRKRAVSESETEETFGFGFNGFKGTEIIKENVEIAEEIADVKPKKKKKRSIDDCNGDAEISEEKPKKKKKFKKDDNTDCYDNPAFDINSMQNAHTVDDSLEVNSKKKKKKKTKTTGIDNPAMSNSDENSSEIGYDNPAFSLKTKIDNPVVADTDNAYLEGEAYDNPAFNPKIKLETITEETEEDNLNNRSTDSADNKKVTKKKNKKLNAKKTSKVEEVFYDNPVFLEQEKQVINSQNKGKKRKKREEDLVENSVAPENSCDSSKTDNEIVKKKKRKSVENTDINIYDNLGFDIRNGDEICNENDNNALEIVKKKKKKRDLPENNETLELNSKIAKENAKVQNEKKKKKKRKTDTGIENLACNADTSEQRVQETITSITTALDNYQMEIENDINEQKDGYNIKTKQQLVAAIKTKSVKINFPGINIYNIKGYGVDYEAQKSKQE